MMAQNNDFNNVEDCRIVAVLHDVLEDCPSITVKELEREGFTTNQLTSLICLTRNYFGQETYEEFINRCKLTTVSRVVKKADMRDNMDMSRILYPTKADYSRLKKYEKFIKEL